MGFFKKLLFGGLGWSLGGPIGAVIGLAIACLFDKNDGAETQRISGGFDEGMPGRRMKYTQQQNANDFRMAFLVMFAAVIKADGHTKKSELAVVKDFLVKNFGEEGALEALQILKSLINQNIDVSSVSRQCGANMSYSTRLLVVQLLYKVACADNELSISEENVISQIAIGMGVTAADLQSIAAAFKPRQSDKGWAYKVLEIEPGANQEEIRKAYRRMAMKYHPDKVSGLGEEAKAAAEEKFKIVKDAYDKLKE